MVDICSSFLRRGLKGEDRRQYDSVFRSTDSEAGLLGFEYTLSQLAVWGRLYFPKMATTTSPIPHAMESLKHWHLPIKRWRQFLLLLNLGGLLQPIECSQSNVSWLLRQAHANLVHFYLVLSGHSLWESSHSITRKPKQPTNRLTPWLTDLAHLPSDLPAMWVILKVDPSATPPSWAVLPDTI